MLHKKCVYIGIIIKEEMRKTKGKIKSRSYRRAFIFVSVRKRHEKVENEENVSLTI